MKSSQPGNQLERSRVTQKKENIFESKEAKSKK